MEVQNQTTVKKIEIIIRTTEDSTSTKEQVVAELLDPDNRLELERNTLSFPGLKIQLKEHRVFKNGKEVHLSRYEYGLLVFLAQHPGQVFTREEIFEAVWRKDSNSYLRAVPSTIGRIRQKIEDDKNSPQYIKTVTNHGYQFMSSEVQSFSVKSK